jgi:hypothetical protein
MTLLYLDLNHWIGLSKARIGHKGCPAAYREMYPIVERLTQTGAIVLPLSEVHYAEIRDRIHSFRQRNDLALVVAELSQYKALPPRDQVLAAQLRASLARHFDVAVAATAPLLVGYGAGYAQRGKPLDGRLAGTPTPGTDPSAKLGDALHEAEKRIGGGWRYRGRDGFANQDWRTALTGLFNEAAEFMILRGPEPSDEPDLRALGYDPEQLAQLMIDVADREKRMKTALTAKPPRDRRPEDVARAAALALDPSPRLAGKALRDIGLSHTAWDTMTKDDMTAVIGATPILDVETSLRLGRLKNRDYSIKINDLYDLAALGLAVSSCDVVATDGSARAMLVADAMDKRHNCQLLSRPVELLELVKVWNRQRLPPSTEPPPRVVSFPGIHRTVAAGEHLGSAPRTYATHSDCSDF